MGWASSYIQQLQEGKTAIFRPKGNSMSGRIESGQLVTVEPLTEVSLASLKIGDIVLCSVGGSQYLHLIKAIRKSGEVPVQFQIGNAKGFINGWVSSAKVYGKCVSVED